MTFNALAFQQGCDVPRVGKGRRALLVRGIVDGDCGPFRRQGRAMEAPMPLDAPVTTAAFPASLRDWLFMSWSFLCGINTDEAPGTSWSD